MEMKMINEDNNIKFMEHEKHVGRGVEVRVMDEVEEEEL